MALFSKNGPMLLPLKDIPEADMGAPYPFIIASEYGLVQLYYYVAVYDLNADGKRVDAKVNDDRDFIAEVSFENPQAHLLGGPDENSNRSHELFDQYDATTELYSGFELITSNKIPQFRLSGLGMAPDGYRHFIFPFHDSTFEIIAKCYTARTLKNPSVLDAAMESLAGWSE